MLRMPDTDTEAAHLKLILINLPAASKTCRYAVPSHTITRKHSGKVNTKDPTIGVASYRALGYVPPRLPTI